MTSGEDEKGSGVDGAVKNEGKSETSKSDTGAAVAGDVDKHGTAKLLFRFSYTPKPFKSAYQRNNKRGGHKNLRCFPRCGENHTNNSFCGRSLRVNLGPASAADVETFRRQTEAEAGKEAVEKKGKEGEGSENGAKGADTENGGNSSSSGKVGGGKGGSGKGKGTEKRESGGATRVPEKLSAIVDAPQAILPDFIKFMRARRLEDIALTEAQCLVEIGELPPVKIHATKDALVAVAEFSPQTKVMVDDGDGAD